MAEDTKLVDQHVGEWLSGFIDGELTQQQRQTVTLHCETCERCRGNLDELRALRERIAESGLSETGEDKWRETMEDPGVKTTRGIGWLLFIAGMLVALGIGIYGFVSATDMSILAKLLVVGVYGGLALLLYSVLRQRLIERKTDKYKDVEI